LLSSNHLLPIHQKGRGLDHVTLHFWTARCPQSAAIQFCCRRVSVTRQYCVEMDKKVTKLFLCLVAPQLWFSDTTYGCEILTGRKACHSGGLRYFRSENA